MADAQWVENIKKIVMKAVEAGDPCDVVLGAVIREDPLEIQLDQKTILSKAQLLVPENLKEHLEKMVIPGLGEVSVTVRNCLKTGKKVLLIQKKGGQQYAVLGIW